MRKDKFNALFRSCAREHLSPTEGERIFVSRVYESVQDVLGERNCLQIGSYPRYTAITPLHDLDVLYILGDWNPNQTDPSDELEDLLGRLRRQYQNPTPHNISISRQTHSITIRFSKGEEEIFGIDIVPVYKSGTNEFGDDKYVVPEIAVKSRRERRLVVAAVAEGRQQMGWIPSDPRGYITAAQQLNEQNDDFRLAVKFAKGWRRSCKERDEEFSLKSFHLEQLITRWMLRNPGGEIFDAVFEFFCGLPGFMRYPQLPDRADPSRNIDQYVADLSEYEGKKVRRARDCFLIKLEEFTEEDDVSTLLEACFYDRAHASEAYLFDQRIPMLTEVSFSIVGEVQFMDGFREWRYKLTREGRIDTKRKIRFRLGQDAPAAEGYKWKVKNDNSCPQPRGEITDHRTASDPERTEYRGRHYVECFAISEGKCIGCARQYVVIGSEL